METERNLTIDFVGSLESILKVNSRGNGSGLDLLLSCEVDVGEDFVVVLRFSSCSSMADLMKEEN